MNNNNWMKRFERVHLSITSVNIWAWDLSFFELIFGLLLLLLWGLASFKWRYFIKASSTCFLVSFPFLWKPIFLKRSLSSLLVTRTEKWGFNIHSFIYSMSIPKINELLDRASGEERKEEWFEIIQGYPLSTHSEFSARGFGVFPPLNGSLVGFPFVFVLVWIGEDRIFVGLINSPLWIEFWSNSNENRLVGVGTQTGMKSDHLGFEQSHPSLFVFSLFCSDQIGAATMISIHHGLYHFIGYLYPLVVIPLCYSYGHYYNFFPIVSIFFLVPLLDLLLGEDSHHPNLEVGKTRDNKAKTIIKTKENTKFGFDSLHRNAAVLWTPVHYLMLGMVGYWVSQLQYGPPLQGGITIRRIIIIIHL